MKLARSIFGENRVFYYIALIVWLSSAFAGIFCALRLEGAGFEDISTYVGETLGKEMSAGAFIKLGIKENISFLIVLIVCSSAPVFVPVSLALCAFKGFASGFTSSIIIRLYSLRGVLIAFGAVILPYAFSMPVIFMMIVSALRFSVGHGTKHRFGYEKDKSKAWFSYISFQLILTSLLSLITVAESFISKLVMGLVP